LGLIADDINTQKEMLKLYFKLFPDAQSYHAIAFGESIGLKLVSYKEPFKEPSQKYKPTEMTFRDRKYGYLVVWKKGDVEE
jgi:hypothetical protein